MSLFAARTPTIRGLRRIFQRTSRSTHNAGAPAEAASRRETAIEQYLAEGRTPWTEGYLYYRERLLRQLVADPDILERFRSDSALSNEYGVGIDERIIEYPWTISQLGDCGPRVLDAGSALNHEFLLEHDLLASRDTLIYTLAPESYSLSRDNVSYIYGDLRETPFRDDYFDVVTCISTLEHVGMDNTMLYTQEERFQECDLDAHPAVVKEMHRVLKPGGIALITVPFGKAENHGWFQQFDLAGVQRIVETFGGDIEQVQFYRYLATGWIRTEAAECAGCEYFNLHAREGFDPDNAAAARAVACLKMQKAG